MIPPIVEDLHPNAAVNLARRIPKSSAIADFIPMLMWFTTIVDCFAWGLWLQYVMRQT